ETFIAILRADWSWQRLSVARPLPMRPIRERAEFAASLRTLRAARWEHSAGQLAGGRFECPLTTAYWRLLFLVRLRGFRQLDRRAALFEAGGDVQHRVARPRHTLNAGGIHRDLGSRRQDLRGRRANGGDAGDRPLRCRAYRHKDHPPLSHGVG